jgi:hypothetical protein
MTTVVPPRFLFRWSFPVPYWPSPPRGETVPPELSAAHQLPALGGVDGQAEFATWRLGWHEQGLALDVCLAGKSEPVRCEPLSPATSSGVHVWFDTRCTQDVHRATRFCHRFALLPVGRHKQQPLVTALPIGQAREAAENSAASVRVHSQLLDDGYRLRAWFPADSLTGYDPDSHARLGFYGVVIDAELGTQALTVGGEFPYESDPSLWQTLELVR